EKLDRPRGAFFSIKHNCAVDHRRPHLDFIAIEANECLLIGCHIEISRENSIRRSAGELHICTLNYFGSMLAKAQHQFVKCLTCFGGYFNPCEALVRTSFPNLDLADLEIGAVGQNLIQNLRKNERINNMPA